MSILSVSPQLFLSLPSGGEWITILLVVIVLFGGKKIPELAKGLGKGIREFNDAKDGIRSEIEAGLKHKDTPVTTTTTAPTATTTTSTTNTTGNA